MKKELSAFRLLRLAIILGAMCGSVTAFDFSTIENKISDFELDNGMKFIILEDHSAPVISFALQVNVGCAYDPKEYMGLSHFWEHMAFKGTSEVGTKDIKKEKKAIEKLDALYKDLRAEELKGNFADTVKLADLKEKFKAAQEEAEKYVAMNEFSLIVEQEGGVGLNAGTGYDVTTYYYSLPSNKMELWFYLSSSRFNDPVLRQFYKEKEVIKEERRMGVESSPFGRLQDEFLHAVFRAHPYGQSLIGEMSDIHNFDKEALLAHFRKHYIPSNMVAVLVGDVDMEMAKSLANEYWGRLPKVEKPRRLAIEEPIQRAERRAIVIDKSQPMLLMGFHRPEVTDDDDVLYSAMADYLGQGRTSLLYKNLVKDKKIATAVQAFDSYPASKYPNLFGVFAMPSQGVSATECETEILAEIQKLKEDLIPDEELEKIKARAKSSFIGALASRNGMARQLANAHTYYGDWRELFKVLDEYERITAEDIQRVANELFTRNNRTVAYIETEE
ncbi:MAG: pitrilysin family protein [Candidatus Zixiibacteriota bacterium]